ncbi:hypothetical protein FSP39_019670 [Pinctada imbricata]|uniref:Uncharacterized protein n=1 Tax=Pinctada imbricata TaxID=66713 RepID=A0AA89C2F8_PINIB|nr:hypothetical protein FSP39_019670 [Pinctada imbricata]
MLTESQSRGCRDMIWPGGQNPCPNLIKSPLYDTADQFCAAPYYAKHCCATCQRWKDRKITRRQLDDNLLMSKLKEAFLSNE